MKKKQIVIEALRDGCSLSQASFVANCSLSHAFMTAIDCGFAVKKGPVGNYIRKLTAEQRIQVRDLACDNNLTGVQIAADYGISKPLVSRYRQEALFGRVQRRRSPRHSEGREGREAKGASTS